MDALYLLRHSPHEDEEIRFSLRSIERHAPHFGKVWIFGDRPAFLSDDTSIIEHVPHSATAGVIGARVPVTNFFLMLFLASLIPELAPDFVRFSDDYILTADFTPTAAKKNRYLKDMAETKSWGSGKWIGCLRRSSNFLRHLELPRLNFEAHTPQYFRRRWIMDAYCELREFATPDRFFGMIGNTEILNHAHARHGLELVKLSDEGTRFGYWNDPPQPGAVRSEAPGKTFLNFDDAAYSGVRDFLAERFPTKSRFEK